MEDIVNSLTKCIINCCKTINNKELLGLEIIHYYDGDCISLEVTIKSFEERADELSKGIAINETINLLDNNILIKSSNCYENKKQHDLDELDEMVKKVAYELVKQLEQVDWKDVTKVADEFYIDLCLEHD